MLAHVLRVEPRRRGRRFRGGLVLMGVVAGLCLASPAAAQAKNCDISCDAGCTQCCSSWTLAAMCGPLAQRVSGDYESHSTASRVASWLNATAAACKSGASCTQRVACNGGVGATWQLLCTSSPVAAGSTADGARLLAAQRHARAQFVAIGDVLPWVAALAKYDGSDFRAKQHKRKANDVAKKLIGARGGVRAADEAIKGALASNASGAAVSKPLGDANSALASGSQAITAGRKLADSARKLGLQPVDTRPKTPAKTPTQGPNNSKKRVQRALVATGKAIDKAMLRAMKFAQRADATPWGKSAAARHQASLQQVKKELRSVYDALRVANSEAQLQKLERQVGELSGRANTEHAQLIRTTSSPKATRR
jgi:hypothetical protein